MKNSKYNKNEEIRQPQILFLIRGHKDFLEDELTQRQTWAKESPLHQTFWVHGDEKIERPLVKDRQILIPLNDSRLNMLTKVLEAVKFSLSFSNPELIILTTTNTYFHIPRVMNVLEMMKSKEFQLAGHLENWSHRDSTEIMRGKLISKGEQFINGATMLLREQAYRSLTGISPKDYLSVPDDLAISYHFKEVGVAWLHVPRNNMYSSHFFIPKYSHRIKGTNDKGHTSKRMILIHNFYNSTNIYRMCLAYLKLQIAEVANVPLKRLIFPKSYLLRIIKGGFN